MGNLVVAALAPMLPERAEVHAERREVEDQRLEPTIERDAVEALSLSPDDPAVISSLPRS